MAIEVEERICMECNKPFKARNENFMCPKCIKKVIAESQTKPAGRADIRAELGYLTVYKQKKKKPQIVIDAKRAKELGMSYGQYMADVKGKGRR